MYVFSSEYQRMLSNILEYTHEYLDQHPYIKGFVVGMSGGIDSALCAALARTIADDRPDFMVIGRSISIVTNSPEEIKLSIAAGKALCTKFEAVNHDRLFNSMYAALRGKPPITMAKDLTLKEKIERGNIKARIRMTLLYDLAHCEDCIVLSTDNLTELLLGFWTLHGDVGDFGMIQGLFKTEVYGLASFMANNFEIEYKDIDAANAIRGCIVAIPTDGLGVSNSDLDQILPGWEEECDGNPIRGYEIVDKILIDYKNHGKHSDGLIVKRHLGTEHKRRNPLNIPRNILLSEDPPELWEVK